MSIQTRIVLGTISFFNALILIILGAGSVAFVNGVAGPVLAGCLWFLAGLVDAATSLGLDSLERRGSEEFYSAVLFR
jgi:hypothetical protein